MHFHAPILGAYGHPQGTGTTLILGGTGIDGAFPSILCTERSSVLELAGFKVSRKSYIARRQFRVLLFLLRATLLLINLSTELHDSSTGFNNWGL